jgi:nucleotide-binding universal stress UspA family protein
MDKRILLGVDASFSPTTQQIMRVVSSLIEDAPSSFYFILLHIIPIAQIPIEHTGPFFEQYALLPPSQDQHKQAEEMLQKACCTLQEYGIMSSHIESQIRVGTPPEEICRMAKERQVDLIVIGSRNNSWIQSLRRFVMGSVSRSILKLAPCPVMIVKAPPLPHTDLESWYEEEIRRDLKQHPHQLLVFTPQETAQRFLPPLRKDVGSKELHAATSALEHLTQCGCLIRRDDIKGGVYYIND